MGSAKSDDKDTQPDAAHRRHDENPLSHSAEIHSPAAASGPWLPMYIGNKGSTDGAVGKRYVEWLYTGNGRLEFLLS